jgi:hypothetical protein
METRDTKTRKRKGDRQKMKRVTIRTVSMKMMGKSRYDNGKEEKKQTSECSKNHHTIFETTKVSELLNERQ